MTGIIADIQRASIHDGPGLRTTIFFKGCNLHCAWCHNPETISSRPEIIFYPEKCIHCGKCKEGCHVGAKVVCGRAYEPGDLLDIVEEDRVYYGETGGLTISGGEPSVQPEFLKGLVNEAKSKGINIGIETNLSMQFDIYEELLPYINYWMADLKLLDDEKHKTFTGASNRRIIENIRELDRRADRNLILRTPVIRDVNDDTKDLEDFACFAQGLKNLLYYEMLPYHPLGLSKHTRHNTYIRRFEEPDRAKLKQTAIQLKNTYGIEIKISNITV